MKTHTTITVLITFILLATAFAIAQKPGVNAASLESTMASTQSAQPNLRALADTRGFGIGAAVAVSPLMNDANYQATLKREFNVVVPENAMKWTETEPQPGVFAFGEADKIVAFAQANGMKIRGHNLVWHNQLPAWLTSETFTRDQLLQIMQSHIQGVAGHYKGKIWAWDVVNEAIADSGGLRKDLWLNTIGPDYIEQAFRFAHAADPEAKLYYNDYGGEGLNRKSNDIYALIKDLKQKGVPIDGVGLQMHIGINALESPSLTGVRDNMARLAALGLDIQITEMDVKIQNGQGSYDEKIAAQAQLYADMLTTCLKQKACNAFLTWGFTDQYSWIPGFTGKPDDPLLFDKQYRPKPCYAALLDVLSQPRL